MKKLLFLVGTRPEAIKTIPVYFEAKKYRDYDSRLLVSGQHKELIDSVLDDFEVNADYTLLESNDKQSLLNTLSRLTVEIDQIINEFLPDLVFVHGDTLTAYVGSLVSFLKRIPIAHIESGLRTNDIYSPYPEEFFRVSIDRVSTLYYCPTSANLSNLHKEGIGSTAIVTGNTGIDALNYMITNSKLKQVIQERPFVLITTHRRESFGLPLTNVFNAINQLARMYPELDFFIPLHPNPVVKESAQVLDKDLKNIILSSPISYKQFSLLMSKSFIIMTDSGGIQEEAVFLGKPLIILRDKTERPEVISSNHAILAGTNIEVIIDSFNSIMENDVLRESMSISSQVFGNGFASKIIMDSVSVYLNKRRK